MNEASTVDATTYVSRLKNVLDNLDLTKIDHAIALIEDAWRAGRQVITLGNGGSALTALHYINDWNKSIYMSTQRVFRGRSLCDNIGLMMAYSNDVSYADVFIEQLKNILEDQDLVIAISGSGNSENVIRAVDYANEHNAVTLGVCGYQGGRLKDRAQHCVWAPVNDMQLSEDVHFFFGHMVMQRLSGYK